MLSESMCLVGATVCQKYCPSMPRTSQSHHACCNRDHAVAQSIIFLSLFLFYVLRGIVRHEPFEIGGISSIAKFFLVSGRITHPRRALLGRVCVWSMGPPLTGAVQSFYLVFYFQRVCVWFEMCSLNIGGNVLRVKDFVEHVCRVLFLFIFTGSYRCCGFHGQPPSSAAHIATLIQSTSLRFFPFPTLPNSTSPFLLHLTVLLFHTPPHPDTCPFPAVHSSFVLSFFPSIHLSSLSSFLPSLLSCSLRAWLMSHCALQFVQSSVPVCGEDVLIQCGRGSSFSRVGRHDIGLPEVVKRKNKR